MKKWIHGIGEAREFAKKLTKSDGGEMCAYIYYAIDEDGGYIVMDELDEPGWECDGHIETWYLGQLNWTAY